MMTMFALPAGLTAAGAATCSKSALNQCLDSVCAINIGMNPAARCQLCHSESAGTPDAALRNISAGALSKNTISATELKSAPSNPTAKYTWAIEQCVKKIDGCTVADTSAYNDLIVQSCRAAGISTEITNMAAAKNTKTLASCENDIRICMNNEKRCGTNYGACEANADFDRMFSSCSVSATGCTEFTGQIRPTLIAARDAAFAASETLVAKLVKKYQTDRETELKSSQDACKDNSARQTCITNVCAAMMPNKCAGGFESERSMATQLCSFHNTACQRLRK